MLAKMLSQFYNFNNADNFPNPYVQRKRKMEFLNARKTGDRVK